jgi:DNA-directed RNA polymerase specialized sigma24 family protein
MSIDPPKPTIADLEGALSTLPQLQRRAFLLAAGERLPYPAAAKRLGISVTQLERLLAKALVSLDRTLS